jgi:hypothetical protein
MILMRVIATMSQDDIGINTRFQNLEPRFDLLSLFRKKSVAKRHDFNVCARRICQKVGRRCSCFAFPLARSAQDAPVNIETNAPVQQAQEGRARSDLNVVRVRT